MAMLVMNAKLSFAIHRTSIELLCREASLQHYCKPRVRAHWMFSSIATDMLGDLAG